MINRDSPWWPLWRLHVKYGFESASIFFFSCVFAQLTFTLKKKKNFLYSFFAQIKRWDLFSLFYKCLLLFSAGEKSRVWRECGVTCQSKPAETRSVSHCRRSGDQLAVHWNSSDTPGSPLTVKSDYSLVQNERLSGLSAKPWQTKLTSPASDWVQECLTSRCKVIPSGKVWRNADLRRVGRKGSECLWRSPCAIDDLTAGQP